MKTPIVDFLYGYAKSDISRLHMPGHKGKSFLGCESLDITEVKGADVLRKSSGIIEESQDNASKLFSSLKTLYSTEGSSQCIKSMLYLAKVCCKTDTLPIIVAARNVHQSFIHAAALCDIQIDWLMPKVRNSICSCPLTAKDLEEKLSRFSKPVAAVYVTSPDYFGFIQPIKDLAGVCHKYGTILIVDNAHGAYLKFLDGEQHPMELGADMCCDSAHKTLPVLTGGAYLHIGKDAPCELMKRAQQAMALFGSTSPSYLVLASLDLCNKYLFEQYESELKITVEKVDALKKELLNRGFCVTDSDPLRVTVFAPEFAEKLQERLSKNGVECEYADRDYLVAMFTPQNTDKDFERFIFELGNPNVEKTNKSSLKEAEIETVLSLREALMMPQDTVCTDKALGRICAEFLLGCPPAIPIAVAGERLNEEAVNLLKYYGIKEVTVIKE